VVALRCVATEWNVGFLKVLNVREVAIRICVYRLVITVVICLFVSLCSHKRWVVCTLAVRPPNFGGGLVGVRCSMSSHIVNAPTTILCRNHVCFDLEPVFDIEYLVPGDEIV
jgi:hypothetical protein